MKHKCKLVPGKTYTMTHSQLQAELECHEDARLTLGPLTYELVSQRVGHGTHQLRLVEVT